MSAWRRIKELRHSDRLYIALLAAGVLAYSLFFSAYQIQRHHTFQTGLDTIHVEQPLWNTLHGCFLCISYHPDIGGEVNDFSAYRPTMLWGDHFQPALLALLLPYALFPRTETLLVILSMAVALGAVPAYRIARRRLGSPGWALFFAGAYLLLPVVQTNTGWDIHGLAFAPPLLLAALDAAGYGAESGKKGWWWLWALLAMGLREDMPLLTGWAMLWMAPKESKREARLQLAIGLAATLVAYLVIIPHFGGGGALYLRRLFPAGTEISASGIFSLLKQPLFWRDEALIFLAYNLKLGMPLLFFYLLSHRALLAMAPVVLMNGLSWFEGSQTPYLFHYSAPLVPWVLAGSMEGFLRLEGALSKLRPAIRWRGLVGAALGTAVLLMQIVFGYTPLSKVFAWPGFSGREASARELLQSIPENAAVSAEASLAAHLSQRRLLRVYPDTRGVDWILVDAWNGYYYYWPHQKVLSLWNQTLQDPGWETAGARNGYILLRRGDGPPENVEEALRPIQTRQETIPAAADPARTLRVRFGGATGPAGSADSLVLHWIDARYISPIRYLSRAVLLCTGWTLEGKPVGTPQIRIQQKNGNALEIPLDSAAFAPGIYQMPGEVQDCTRIPSPSSGDQMDLEFSVGDFTGGSAPTTIEDFGGWAGKLEVEGSNLIIHLSLEP